MLNTVSRCTLQLKETLSPWVTEQQTCLTVIVSPLCIGQAVPGTGIFPDTAQEIRAVLCMEQQQAHMVEINGTMY